MRKKEEPKKTAVDSYMYYAKDLDKQKRLYCEIHPKLGKYSIADVCFICDITGNMDNYIDMIKNTFLDFITNIKALTYTNPRFAFIGFRDKVPKYIPDEDDECDEEDKKEYEQLEIQKFTENRDEMMNFIKSIQCGGGGDICEDLISPLKSALELEWKSEMRYVYLLLELRSLCG